MRPGLYEARSLDTGAVVYVRLVSDADARRRLAVAHGALQWVRWHVAGSTLQYVKTALQVLGDMGED